MKEAVISIVMPAYNEEANIEGTVRRCMNTLALLNLEGEVVVTNDGSRDQTQSILERLQGEFPNLTVVSHEHNQGYGAGLQSAMRAAMGDVIVTLDSDGQFDISELPLFLELHRQGQQVISGYRRAKKDSPIRVFANQCLVWLTRAMFGLKLRDANTAFKLYEAKVIRNLNIESRGYQTPTEIMIKLTTQGLAIGEVGVTHAHREGGKSALGLFKTTYAMIMFLIYLRLKIYLYRAKMIHAL